MVQGKNIVGFNLSSQGSKTFRTFSPVTLKELPELFVQATNDELEEAVRKSVSAFSIYKRKSGKERAVFLRKIADEIENTGDELIERACAETGLPQGRITGERGRTTNQLRMFAKVLEDGNWTEASIDPAMPDREPLPRADIRKILQPVGPVAVFTASNFPLAFSTAGGDTASALAAGNPVIVKSHPYHTGTNELVSLAIIKAAKECDMPDGVFSSLNAIDFSIGQSLVLHPKIKSVAFTGSFQGGKSLYELAQKREEPIPVFAEMGSVNPVLILPGKLTENAQAIADKISSSVNLGAGQFCTNPGVLIALKGPETEAFKNELASSFQKLLPEKMLHKNIISNYEKKTKAFFKNSNVVKLAESETEPAEINGRPAVAVVSGKDFASNPELADEIFGPFSLLVECDGKDQLQKAIKSFRGQLTATVFCTSNDIESYKDSIESMQELVGRLIFNGVPTGVEVGYSMQHGGPYPATTDARFTSVGADAIKRFVRPVAFQDAPNNYLPDELKDENPLGIWRRVNGELTNKPIKR